MVSYRALPPIMSPRTPRIGPDRGRSADAGASSGPAHPAHPRRAARLVPSGVASAMIALAAILGIGCETEQSYRERQQQDKEKYALRDPAVLVMTHQVHTFLACIRCETFEIEIRVRLGKAE